MKDFIRNHGAIILMSFIMWAAGILAIGISFNTETIGAAAGMATTIKFLVALVGVSMWFVFLRISDAVAGVMFKEAYLAIQENGIACAIYFGCRCIGAGILIGMVLG